MRRLLTLCVVASAFTAGGLLAQGGIGPIGNLQGRVDANNALVVRAAAAGATGAATAPIANLPGKVDASNNLLVTVGAGTLTPDKLCLDATNQDACIQRNGAGVLQLGNAATSTDFARLQFGGTTSSFPALKRSGATLQVRLADDSDNAALSASSFSVGNSGGSISLVGGPIIRGTAPTIASGFGTSPSIVASNGTAAFSVNVGTGGTANQGILTMPAATTGWNCYVNNETAAAAHVAYNTRQIASTTTSVTLENQTTSTGAAVAWAASNILKLACLAY